MNATTWLLAAAAILIAWGGMDAVRARRITVAARVRLLTGGVFLLVCLCLTKGA